MTAALPTSLSAVAGSVALGRRIHLDQIAQREAFFGTDAGNVSPKLKAMFCSPGVIPLEDWDNKLLLAIDQLREPSIVSVHVICPIAQVRMWKWSVVF